MIHVVERARLDVPIDVAWTFLSDLERLATVNLFHRTARFAGGQRAGARARFMLDHGLPRGPVRPRLVRITHWEERRRIRWTEVDPSHPRYLFPHSQEFRLEPLVENATLLTDEVRGTLNLPVFLAWADKVLEALLVRRVVRLECATLKKQIDGWRHSCTALRASGGDLIPVEVDDER